MLRAGRILSSSRVQFPTYSQSLYCKVGAAARFNCFQISLMYRCRALPDLQVHRVDVGARSTCLQISLNCLDAEPYLIYGFIEQTLQPGSLVTKCLSCLDAEPYLIYEFIEQTLQPGPHLSNCLSCLDAEPYLIYEFIEQTLQPGPPVCLKCSCRGSPTPQITWLKNGFSLPPSERYHELTNHRPSLKILFCIQVPDWSVPDRNQ